MNQKQFTEFFQQFHTTISETAINLLAHTTGFCQRLRDIAPFKLIGCLITAMGSGNIESIADLQRRFNEWTGQNISYRATYNQLTKEAFPTLMREFVTHLMNHWVQQTLSFNQGHVLSQFNQILIQDGSSFALKDSLADKYPGRFTETSPAAVELHVTMDLLADQPCAISLTPDTLGERDHLPAASELHNRLILIDRGYFDLSWFDAVDRQGGFYVARAKNSLNPIVDEGWKEDGAALKHVKEKRLKSIQNKLFKRQRTELMVRWEVKKGYWVKARLISFWNADEKRYTWLITNLPRSEFSLIIVSDIYRLRWQIELLFKEWKSYANLHRFDTGNEYLVEGLIWASIASALMKRFISSSAQMITGKMLSTRKVAMSCSFYFTRMMVGIMNGKLDEAEDNARFLVKFLGDNARRSHPKRDRKSGRGKLGLKAVGDA